MNLRFVLRQSRAARRDVTAQQAADLIDNGAVLLDVREQHEWDAGHAPRARHIPLPELSGRTRELPTDQMIVAVCRSGNRSAHAAALLAEAGQDAANLKGGMRAWARSGLPIVTAAGDPGEVA